MKRVKKKIKLVSLLTALIFLFELFSPVFYEMVQAELYMSVSGKITDKSGGNAIEKATVVIIKVENSQATKYFDFVQSDKEGKYVLDIVPPGDYRMFVVPPKGSAYAMDLSSKNVKVSRGKNLINVDAQLEEGCAISGKIYQEDELTPLINTRVIAFSAEGSFGFGITDKSGTYIVKNLKPGGNYNIIAIPESKAVALAKDLTVTSGEVNSNVNLALSRNDNVSLSGIVVDQITSDPIKDAFVILTRLGDGGFDRTIADGKFSLTGLAQGEYKLQIIAQGYKTFETTISLSKNDTKTVNFKLEKLTLRQGKVPDEITPIAFYQAMDSPFISKAFASPWWQTCVDIFSCIFNADSARGCIIAIIACAIIGGVACTVTIGPEATVSCAVGGGVVCGVACIIAWIVACVGGALGG